MGLCVQRLKPGDELRQGDPKDLAELLNLDEVERPLSRLVFANEGLWPGQLASDLLLPDAFLQAKLAERPP